MKNKRKKLKSLLALLLCLLMAAGTAVPAFAMEEVDADDFNNDYDDDDYFSDGYSLDILNKPLTKAELDDLADIMEYRLKDAHRLSEIAGDADIEAVLRNYMKLKHPGYDDYNTIRANEDWANISTAFSIFQGISSIVCAVNSVISMLQMMGLMKGEADPSVAILERLDSLKSSVDEVDRKLDAIQDTLVNEFAELDLKLQQQDFNHYKDDVWAKFYTDAVVPLNNIQTEYSLRVNDLLLDYIELWQNGENKTDLRSLFGKNEENGEIIQVFSGRNMREPGKALPIAPEVSLDSIPVEYSIILPAEYITGNIDKAVYLTSDNYIDVLKDALAKGIYQAAQKGEITAYPGFEKEWLRSSEEEKQETAEKFALYLADALAFACSYNAVNEKGFSSDVKNAYLNFSEWLLGSESLTSPLTAQLKMLSLSHVFEGEIADDADEITYYLCMMNLGFYNFTQSVLAMSKSQSEEQKIEVRDAYYSSEVAMTLDYTDFLTGNPNYCYVTGTVLEYKNTTLESTMKSYHVQFNDIEFDEENENTQYAIPEGFNYTRWKIFEKGASDSEKDTSQDDLMARTITPKQAKTIYAMYETSNTGISFSDFLVNNNVAATAEQVTRSGIITSLDTENLDLDKESAKMTCYLPSNHGTYAYTPGKEYTVKSGVASDLNIEGNYRLHDKATGGLLDLSTGNFNENAPLEYRVYYHGKHNKPSGGESSVHRLIAFSTADFSSTDTVLPWGCDELRNLGGNWWNYTGGRTESVFTSDRYGMLVSSELSTYTFPKSTKKICSKFFGNSADIDQIIFDGTPESIANNAFDGIGTSYKRCLLTAPFETDSLLNKWHGGYFGNTQITIDKNDGSGEKETIAAVNGAPISSVVCTFTAPDQAAFSGWSYYPNGAAANTTDPIFTGMTLYAIWKYDHEHDFEETKEAVDATCTKAGSTQERTCKTCGYKDVQVIPATGHTCTFTKSGSNYLAKCTCCDYQETLSPKNIGSHTVWSENKTDDDVKYITDSTSGAITYINQNGVYVIGTGNNSRQTIEIRDGVNASVCLAGVDVTGSTDNIPCFNIGKANIHLTLIGENTITSYCSNPFDCEGDLTVDGTGSLALATDSKHIPFNTTGTHTVINGGNICITGGDYFSVKINDDVTGGDLVIEKNACFFAEKGIDIQPVNGNGEKVYPTLIENPDDLRIFVDYAEYPFTTSPGRTDACVYLTSGKHDIRVGTGRNIYVKPEIDPSLLEMQYGDFTVINHRLDPNVVSFGPGKVLTVKKSSPITIKNTDPSTATLNSIQILPNVDADITLAGVNINLRDAGGAAILIAPCNGAAQAGNVKITLAKDTENILHGGGTGISMNDGYTSLTIEGKGSLTVTGERDCAAIGSGSNKPAGNITINGGTINATAGSYFSAFGSYAAAIGSGKIGAEASVTGYATGNITINGGTVYANSYQGPAVGAGISEKDLLSKKITVNGGMLIACSNNGEYTIGGNKTEEVVINGGVVTAGTGTAGKGGINASKIVIENTASVKTTRVNSPVNGLGKSVTCNEILIDENQFISLNGKGYRCIGHNGENKLYLYLAEDEKVALSPAVRFEKSDRGTVSCSPAFPLPGEEVVLNASAHDGYAFVDYELSPAVEIKDGIFTMPNAPLTIKGIFARIGTVTVTESDHGKVMPSKSIVTAGEKVTLRAFPEEGYELDTLTVTNAELDAYGESFIMPEEDVAVTCTFKPKTKTVTWIVDDEKTEEEVIFGKEITKPSDPEKAGYKFAGWTPAIPETMPDTDMEFVAVFEPITYTAVFMADGKEVNSVEYDLSMGKLDEPAVPQKLGYTGKWEEYTLTAGGITVNAVYTPIKYTARFIADGVLVKNVTYTVNTLSLEEPDVPEKSGYTGAWSEYTLTVGGITVKAVYTPDVHEHTFASKYSHNDAAHWFDSTCNHDVASHLEAHSFGEGVIKGDATEYTCTKCGYVKTVVSAEYAAGALAKIISDAQAAVDKAAAGGSDAVLEYAETAKTEIRMAMSGSEVTKKLAEAINTINKMKTEEAAADAVDTLDSVTASTSKGQSIIRMAKLLLDEAKSPEEVSAILADALTKLEAEESAEAEITEAKTVAKEALAEKAGEKQSDEMKSIIADVESVIDAAQTADQVAAALELGEAAVQTQLDKEAADASLEKAEASLADAKEALEKKNAALKEAEDKLKAANEALDKAKQDLEDAQGDIEAKAAALEAAEKSLTDAQNELNNTKKELADKAAALETAQANLTAANKALDKAKEQVEALTAGLEKLNGELAETKSALNTANDQVTALTAELNKANEYLDKAESDLADAKAEITSLTADLTKANEDLDKAESDLADAKAEITALTADLTKANDELAGTKAALEKAEDDLKKANAEKTDLETQLASKETELENLRESGEAKDREIKALEDEIAELENAIETKDEEITAKAGEIAELEKSVEDLEKTVKAGKDEITAKAGEIAELEKSVEDLEKAVENKDKELAEKTDAVTELEKSVNELENKVKDKEDEIAEKKERINDLEKSITNLEASVQTKETEVAEKTEEIKSLENSVQNLETEVSKAQEELEDKNAQIEELSEKLEEAQAEIEELKVEFGICPECGKVHKDNFFGKIACFFHRIGNFFRNLFKKIFG